jgi:hypothetical protein
VFLLRSRLACSGARCFKVSQLGEGGGPLGGGGGKGPGGIDFKLLNTDLFGDQTRAVSEGVGGVV